MTRYPAGQYRRDYMKGLATMTDINKEYEKEYYDEYRNNYYNPDDDNGEPGINLNWKRIQKGFHSVAAGDQETAETLSGMQANLETLNTDVETLKTDVDEIKESVDDLNTAVETAEQAAAAASASEAAAEAAQAAIEEIKESIPEDYTALSDKVTALKNDLVDQLEPNYMVELVKGVSVNTSGPLMPFRIHAGDKITVSSKDGSTFGNVEFRYYDADKNYVDYLGLYDTQGNSRTFTVSKEAYYVGITTVILESPNAYIAVNNSNAYYKDIVPYADRPDITKYLNISKNDINSLKKNSSANFVFCSDLQAGEINLARIISFAESIGNVSAIVNGGDTTNSLYGDNIAWYDTLVSASTIPVLTCVGNHDVWSKFWVTADQKDVYNKFIAPVKTNVPAIVQPTDASTDGLNYYYFDIGNLRIIVLAAMITRTDTMYWNSDQKTWLESALEDAHTNNKSVICVNHSPFKKADAVIDYDSSLNTWVTYNSDVFDGIHLAPEAIAAVDDFIEGGGVFICWLTGHTHVDYIMTETAAPGQLMVSIASAKYSNHFDGYSPASKTAISERNYDCFDLIGVDLTNKILKVLRIGYNQDASMKVRNRYSYNYGSGKLVGIS